MENPVKPEAPIRVHIRNTRWETPENQAIFTITPEHFAEAVRSHPDLASSLEPSFGIGADDFEEDMRSAEVLVGWDFPTENLAETAPALRLIHIIGAGVEHLYPMDWVPEAVTVVNNKGAHANKAGDYGLMSVLMLHNHVPQLIENQKSGFWRSLYSTPIEGRTLLVIGVGSIGSAIARKANEQGLRVLGVTRHGAPVDGVDEMATTAELDTMLPRADFVFVSTPSTPETRNLLDRRRLGLMRRGAGIVNVGRADVIDYEALSEMLESGHLGGAILDVFDPEPLPSDSPLWKVKNLLVTPHVSADDGDSYAQITLDLVFANLRRYLAGEPLHNVVRTELGY
jgi:phosphoglycerate dehydrogenase-like enzyme